MTALLFQVLLMGQAGLSCHQPASLYRYQTQPWIYECAFKNRNPDNTFQQQLSQASGFPHQLSDRLLPSAEHVKEIIQAVYTDQFRVLLDDLLEKGLVTKDSYRHYNQCDIEDLPRVILVSVLGKEESYCQAFLSILCVHFPWICEEIQQDSADDRLMWANEPSVTMRNHSELVELPLLKDLSFLGLLQDDYGPRQMSSPIISGQCGDSVYETDLDINQCELNMCILDDIVNPGTSLDQYEEGIEGILKYLQDPRPLNTIALEQYFDNDLLLETQEFVMCRAPTDPSDDDSSCSADDQLRDQSSPGIPCTRRRGRKRATSSSSPTEEQETITQATSIKKPKPSGAEPDAEATEVNKVNCRESPSPGEEVPSQILPDVEALLVSPGCAVETETPDSIVSMSYSPGPEALPTIPPTADTQHPVSPSTSLGNGLSGLPLSPGVIQLITSCSFPQQVISFPFSGTIQSGIATYFIVANKSLPRAPELPLTVLSPTLSSAASGQSCAPPSETSWQVDPSPAALQPDPPVSPKPAPHTPLKAESPPEPLTSSLPADSPTPPASIQAEGPVPDRESPGEGFPEPVTPTVKQFIKTKAVEDCTVTVKEYLKDMSQHSYICHEHDEMHLEDIYVDITLVEGQVETKSGRKSNKGLDKACKIYNIDEGEHAAISTDNLFDFSEREQRETKVIALLGRAGIGKSVLVQRVCLDWVNGSFGQFEFVFWFKCRTLNLEKQYKLRDLLFEPFLPALRDTGEVFQYLCHHPDKVLVIVDDFEDFQDCDGLLQPTTCPSREKPQSVRQLLAGLLQKKLLRGCTVLVTARPRGTFNQYLTRVDKVVEVMGFSPQHREEFVRKYFEDSSLAVKVSECLQQHRFMLSFCFIPLFCRFLCFILKAKHRAGDKCLTLPATLTSLFQSIFQVLLQSGAYTRSGTQTPALLAKHKANLLRLSTLAYSGVQSHSSVCAESETAAMTNFALKHGFLRPFLMNGQEREQECGKAFSHSALQNFLGAMYLLFSEDVKCKGLLRIIMLEQKKKRSQEDWLDIVRRALVGLAFQEGSDFIDCFVNNPKNKVKSKKQKSLQRYLGELDTSALSGVRLLELCHCVHETQNPELATRVASKLNETLSFLRTRLTPPDIFVLLHLMQKSPRKFCIDLRETGIDLPGIRQFVELKNVTSFRVSVTDAVKLWEHLEQTGEEELLHTSLLKFSVNPFEVNSLKDIDDLDLLVQLHKGRRFLSCAKNACGSELHELPAVSSLQTLEFALGPVIGPQGFQKLAKILPALQSLKSLDLEGPSAQKIKLSENQIGDEGAERLAEVLSELTSLEKLTLSRNQITDRGAQTLARSLPKLKSLRTLSLYDNIIGDKGAEKLAEILPAMTSLKVLDVQFNNITDVGAQSLTHSLKNCPHMESIWLWSPTIPHWVSDHLKQIDVRINLQ
eukprot:gi/632973322/ref/XP_007903097.1/ PREDICTED: MHC class II transactivator [Callorhinchus milii]